MIHSLKNDPADIKIKSLFYSVLSRKPITLGNTNQRYQQNPLYKFLYFFISYNKPFVAV